MDVKAYLNLIRAITAVLGAGVVTVLFIYNPESLGPLGVTLWFIGLFVALQGGITLALYWLKRHYRESAGEARQFAGSWRQGVIIAGLLVVMLALSSLRQLSSRDIWLLLVLGILVEFYGRSRK